MGNTAQTTKKTILVSNLFSWLAVILSPVLIYGGFFWRPDWISKLGDQTLLWSPFHPLTILLVGWVTLIIYGFLFNKTWVRGALILLILLPMLGYLLAFTSQIKTEDGSDNSTLFSSFELLLLVISAGGFGGLMFGLKDGKWYWPTTNEKNVTDVGFLKHLLIGAAGGIVIFIILPGEYNLVKDGKGVDGNQIKYIQFIGLAFLGGFGGYALVERVYLAVTQESLREAFADNAKELAEREKYEAETLELINQYLENKTMGASYFFEHLEKRLQKATIKTRLDILLKVKEARQAKWKELVGNPTAYRLKGIGAAISNEDLKESEVTYQKFVDKVVPILSTLSKHKDANDHHRIFGQLGFALKDKVVVDYQGALDALNHAIKIRGDLLAGEMYEFNRAICRIMLETQEGKFIREDFKKFAENNEGKRILKDILINDGQTQKLADESKALRKVGQNDKIIDWFNKKENVGFLKEMKAQLGITKSKTKSS